MTDNVKLAPTEEWVKEQKAKYGKIFKTVISGETYVYRQLLRTEYREVQKSIESTMTERGQVLSPEQSNDLEEKIVELCVIWPEDFSNKTVAAGVPSMLSAMISDASGYQVEEAPQEL